MRILRVLLAAVLGLGAAYLALHLAFGWMLEKAFPGLSGEEKTILSDIDLSDGDYQLLIDNGERDGEGPESAIARLIDDAALIERYRDDIDITFSLTEFLPGEGRGDHYVYLYRDGERVAGRNVPSAFQVKAPEALLQAGRPMRERTLYLPLAPYREALERIEARPEAILRSASEPEPDPDLQHSFRIGFPTIAVEEGFDAAAYAARLAERIMSEVQPLPLRIDDPRDEQLGGYLLSEDGEYLRGDDDLPLTLPGVELYNFYLLAKGAPVAHAAIGTLDLDSYVAELRGTDLIVAAWMEATGAEDRPSSIGIMQYVGEGSLSTARERTYRIRYWEPAEEGAR